MEERTRRQERTRSFDLWAWCCDPCDIPAEVWLTVPEPDRELLPTNIPLPMADLRYDAPTDLKRGHVYVLRNHLEVVEDLSFLQGRGRVGGPPNRKARREFVWSYGVPDTEGERQLGWLDNNRGRDYRHRPRRDDDDFDQGRQRGVRRHRSVSSWTRGSHCRGVEDCISSNRWGGRRESPPRRHRALSDHSRIGQSALKPVLKWVKKRQSVVKPQKHVTFADPISTELKAPKKIYPDDSILLIKGNHDHQFFADPYICSTFSDPTEVELLCFMSPVPVPNKVLQSLEEMVESLTNQESGKENTMEKENFAAATATAIEVPLKDNTAQLPEITPRFHLDSVTESLVDTDTTGISHPNTPTICGPLELNPLENVSTGAQPNGNSVSNDDTVTNVGKDVDAFLDSILLSTPTPIFSTPPRLDLLADNHNPQVVVQLETLASNALSLNSAPTQRKSTRLAKKACSSIGKNPIKVAQDLLIKKLGALTPTKDASTSNRFDFFAQHFEKPISKGKMEAIKFLVEQGNAQKKKAKSATKMIATTVETTVA